VGQAPIENDRAITREASFSCSLRAPFARPVTRDVRQQTLGCYGPKTEGSCVVAVGRVVIVGAGLPEQHSATC
jgi:hypothetical protein